MGQLTPFAVKYAGTVTAKYNIKAQMTAEQGNIVNTAGKVYNTVYTMISVSYMITM